VLSIGTADWRVSIVIPLLLYSVERLHGARQVSSILLVALCVFLSITAGMPEATLFALLLAAFFLQAKTIEEKKQFLAAMDKYRKRNRPEKLLPKEFDYLKHWYNCVIREMAELPDFKAEPEWIVKNSLYPIRKKDAAEAIGFLFDTGFLSLDERGKARKKEKSLVAAEIEKQNEFATIMRNFHLGMLRIAEKAVGDLPKSERSVTNNTLSFSKNGYETALKRIEQLNYELLELAKSDTNANQIYQVNINVFPFLKDRRNAGGEA
jgi:uncharacterized protein (TIGR02147 family)